MSNAPLLVYNLFPPLAGHIATWTKELDRARAMGFNAVYVNPLYYPGFSGSLYAVKDYYSYNPAFFTSKEKKSAEKELRAFTKECEKRALMPMLDFVINHTASDSVLREEHPQWYAKDEEGNVKSPGAWDNGEWVSWGDLAEIDNEGSEDKEALWSYWRALLVHSIDLGFYGFRCDAAYQVPVELWKMLINAAKSLRPDAVFLAETLGCPIEDTIALADAGFDYVMSSSRWWNFKGSWLPDQYEETRVHAPSVGFPENHDTLRAITEYKGNINKVLLYLQFTAYFSKGFMITQGYEYGYGKRCDVVHYTSGENETPRYDITENIRRVLAVKTAYPLLCEEGEIEILTPFDDEDPEAPSSEEGASALEDAFVEECAETKPEEEAPTGVFVMIKWNKKKTERALIACNLNTEEEALLGIKEFPKIKKDVSPATAVSDIAKRETLLLAPGEVKAFILEREERAERR